MATEKRRFSRVLFDARAILTVGEQTLEAHHINNLSIGGCFMPMASNLEVGSPCRIAIQLSDANRIAVVRVEGKIVRADIQGVAIKFTAIDPDSLIHLQNIVLHNSPDVDKAEEEIRHHPGLV